MMKKDIMLYSCPIQVIPFKLVFGEMLSFMKAARVLVLHCCEVNGNPPWKLAVATKFQV
jgi:hypothetical protein